VTHTGPLRAAIEFDIEFDTSDAGQVQLTTRASLDTQQAQLDIQTTVHTPPEVHGNQWKNHLGVRLGLPDPKFTLSTCHFNVLEEYDRPKIFSPNVLVAHCDGIDIAMLNAGNQFYVRDGETLSNILVVENESTREFHYAIGAAETNPIAQGLNWRLPCFVHAGHAASTAAGSLVTADRPAISFIDIDHADIALLSCGRLAAADEADAGWRVRLANTCDQKRRAILRAAWPIRSASITDLTGKTRSTLDVQNDAVTLEFRPWDIVQIQMHLSPTA
jgi:hypothetical protein